MAISVALTVRLRIKVTPRAATDAIDGWTADGALRVRVRAVPADGRANDAVVRLLAHTLALPMRRLKIVAGASSRVKVVEIDAPHEAIAERLPATSPAHPPGSAVR